MIPWVREKFAERRAKWLAARNKRATEESKGTVPGQSSSVSASDRAVQTDIPQDYEVDDSSLRARLQSTPSTSSACRSNSCSYPTTRSIATSTTTASPAVKSKLTKTKSARRGHSQQSNVTINSSEDTVLGRPKENIKIRIICPSARVLLFQTDINKRIVELKNEIILELSDDPASMPHFATDVRQLSPRYRLLKADNNGLELNESFSLAQYHITNNDTMILVARRNNLHQASLQAREIAPPREQDIEQATRTIPHTTNDMPLVDINEIFQQSNLQFDVRKVLISLAQASAAIIGSGPYAKRLIAMLKQKLINKRNYQNDTLQCLVDMGFKKEKAEYALKTHHNVYSSALEWLILNQSDDVPLQQDAAVGMQKSRSIISPSGILTNDGFIENTEALLEIVRIYSHRDIPPPPETIAALVEMGFAEQEVLIALKKTCNNKAAACEWLCGNRSGSLVELRDGLAPDSPILKSILELPQVQISLSNPKILLAFLSILENEQSIRVWGGDSDTTSVITHILQKYHEEKHVMGINQFYNNR